MPHIKPFDRQRIADLIARHPSVTASFLFKSMSLLREMRGLFDDDWICNETDTLLNAIRRFYEIEMEE